MLTATRSISGSSSTTANFRRRRLQQSQSSEQPGESSCGNMNLVQIPTRNNSDTPPAKSNSSAGFTLLETVVAMVILSTALLGVASAIGYALMVSNSGRGVTNTKLLVVSVLEQMETLRNNGQLTFGQIANACLLYTS